jgi:hypothetical protein
MKMIALSCSLFVAMAISAIAAPPDNKGTATAPHQINGVLEGTFTFVPFGLGPFDVDTLGDVSGIVKGLGQTNMFTFHRPTPDGGGVTNGLVRIVAANGDRIRCEYVGTTGPGTEPNQLIGRAEFVISGGTGRFANASGTIHAAAYVTFMGFTVFEWPVTWVLEGTISY